MPSEKRTRKRQNAQVRAAAERAAQRRAQQRRRAVRLGPFAIVIAVLLIILITRSSGKSKAKVTSATTTTTTLAPPGAYGTTPCPKPDGSSTHTTSFPAPFQNCLDAGKAYAADMKTDAGDITIALDAVKAPLTANNFVALARYHFYDGLTFHRVIAGFVVQGGDPKGDGSGGPGYQFRDELPKAGAYQVGSLAMANSGPNTNGSQFFIIVGQQGVQLPPQYSLFGTVTQGIDVAHKIEADGGPDGSPPKVLHKIVSVTITET